MADRRLVSIDSGSSYLKFYDGNQEGAFPSYVEHVQEYQESNYADLISFNGKKWAIGHAALAGSNEPPAHARTAKDFHGSEDQRIQFCYVFDKMALSNGEHPCLVSSLPYDLSLDRGFVEGLKRELSSFEWRDPRGKDRTVRFREVILTPQGVGAWLLYQNESNAQKTPRLVTLVDIGGATLDVVTTQYNPETRDYAYNKASSSDRDVVIDAFKKDLQNDINKKAGLNRDFGFHELMGYVTSGIETSKFSFLHQGREIQFDEEFRALQAEFTRRVYTHLELATKKLWPAIELILITGGGASLVDEIHWPESDRRPVKMGLHANVIGQYNAAKPILMSADEAATGESTLKAS